LDIYIINDFKGKIEDFEKGGNPEKALPLAMCWLYTTDSWVYKDINLLLREDTDSIKVLAPYMNGLINSYQKLEDGNLFFGTVYRRTRLSKKDLEFYKPNVLFVWLAFTSTSEVFDSSSDVFGDTLFVITLPEKFKRCALNMESVSPFKSEKEVLLLPNIGYTVTETQIGPTETYPNTKFIIHVTVSYLCST